MLLAAELSAVRRDMFIEQRSIKPLPGRAACLLSATHDAPDGAWDSLFPPVVYMSRLRRLAYRKLTPNRYPVQDDSAQSVV